MFTEILNPDRDYTDIVREKFRDPSSGEHSVVVSIYDDRLIDISREIDEFAQDYISLTKKEFEQIIEWYQTIGKNAKD